MLFASPAITAYCLFIAALLGLCMGSFLNCLAWRSTHGESVLHGRSHCASCGHELSARDLVPVASWLAARGRCRYCGARVSLRYPATEILCAIVYVSLVLRYGLTLEAVEMLAFAGILLALSLTDLDEHVIPNAFIIAAIAVRILYLAALAIMQDPDALRLATASLIGGIALGAGVLSVVLVADRVLGRESMGGGDIKLFFVMGLYFGWQQGLLLLILSCLLGIVFALVGMGRGGAPAVDGSRLHAQMPFGPAIAAAAWAVMLAGGAIVGWYLGFF